MMYTARRAPAFLLAAVVCLSVPVATLAQGSGELTKALRRAQDAYDNIEFGEAERGLEDAIALAERLGQDQTPEAADLHLFLGVVRHAVSGDAAAEDAFVAGLTINPSAQLSPDYATPQLEEILERARGRVPTNVPDPGPDITPDLTPAGFDGMRHDPIETATAGTPLQFQAEVSANTPVYRVTVHYRRFGEREYTALPLQPSGDTKFVGLLDGKRVRTSQIDYYIEATDRTGKTLVGAGGALSPLSVIVFGDTDTVIGDPDPDPDPDPEPGSGERRHMYLTLGAGSGLGLATGDPIVNPDVPIRTGLAPTPLHINAELGFYLMESLTLGAFMRGQLVLLTEGIELEPIFGGKLAWWFDNDGALRLYSGVGGGFGFVRHTVDLNPTLDFVDTTREGPAHAGVGFGLGYFFNDYVALVLDAYVPVLFPTLSVQADIQLGLRVMPF